MSEELNEELRKCPFCGCHAYIDYYDHSYTATCGNCFAELGKFEDKEDCIKAWNNRPLEDEKDKELKEQKKLMKKKCYDCLDAATGYYRKKLIENELKGIDND